jgi:hypothetical protein
MNEVIKSWKCDEGDVVEFHFSRYAAEKGKPPLKGVVIGREPKLVSIRVDNSEQVVRIHVSLIKVMSAALTPKRIKGALCKKFTQKLSNNRTAEKKVEVVNEVAGMTFKYKK